MVRSHGAEFCICVLQNDVVYLPEDPILGGSDCANFTETQDGVLNAAI